VFDMTIAAMPASGAKPAKLRKRVRLLRERERRSERRARRGEARGQEAHHVPCVRAQAAGCRHEVRERSSRPPATPVTLLPAPDHAGGQRSVTASPQLLELRSELLGQ
jgi:hypothetical protein